MASDKRAVVLARALECCKAHEPGVRLIGNVTAAQLRELLEHVVTDAEMAVLKASGAIVIDNLIQIAERNGKRMARWARAELARRNGGRVPARREEGR